MLLPFPLRLVPLAALLAVSLLTFPACTQAADTTNPAQRKVTVVGTATIQVAPDEMHWTVQISINDATLVKAKARHDAALAEALQLIKSLGGAVKDLQTGGIRFDRKTYFSNDEDKTKPFSCSTQLTFTLTDFDKYGTLSDGLAKLDGAEIQNIEYASSKAEATRREALKQALIKAREKANDLAVTAGCYIDKPLLIEEGAANDGPMPRMAALAASSGTPAAVAGKLDITASVTATYDMYYR